MGLGSQDPDPCLIFSSKDTRTIRGQIIMIMIEMEERRHASPSPPKFRKLLYPSLDLGQNLDKNTKFASSMVHDPSFRSSTWHRNSRFLFFFPLEKFQGDTQPALQEPVHIVTVTVLFS